MISKHQAVPDSATGPALPCVLILGAIPIVRAGIVNLMQNILAGKARFVSADWASLEQVIEGEKARKIRFAVACADAALPAETWARMVGVVREGAVLVVRTASTPPAQHNMPSIAIGAPMDKWRQAIQFALAASRRQRPGAAVQAGAMSPAVPSPLSMKMTQRQREVLALISEGLPNKVIAERLGLTVGTVKLHVAAVLHALSARNRVEVIMHGNGNGNGGAPSAGDTWS